MTVLKRCPFCGEYPSITAYYGYDDGGIYTLDGGTDGKSWQWLRDLKGPDGRVFTNAGVICECGLKCMWEVPIEGDTWHNWRSNWASVREEVTRLWNTRVGEHGSTRDGGEADE